MSTHVRVIHDLCACGSAWPCEQGDALKAADALADWVGWWLSARREEEQSKFSEMRRRLDAYRAARRAEGEDQ